MPCYDIEEINNISEFENKANETYGPICIRKNEKNSFILMNTDYFNDIMIDNIENSIIDKGMSDVENGRTIETDQLFADIKSKYGF